MRFPTPSVSLDQGNPDNQTRTSNSTDASDAFIAKWRGVTASELSTAQSFALDLCQLLEVEAPHPDAEQQYMFERPLTFHHGDGSTSAGRIDLYKRGCFVLQAKKLKAPMHIKGFDDSLLCARSQAERYARALRDEIDAAVLDVTAGAICCRCCA